MTSDERQQLIAQYKDGYAEVTRALENFPSDALTANLISGKWSAAEIVHHLADSETTSAMRLRRLLVEDHPVIQGYDQDAFAAKLHYNKRDVAPALDAFRCARATTTQLLDLMTEDDWRREGTHSESVSYSITRRHVRKQQGGGHCIRFFPPRNAYVFSLSAGRVTNRASCVSFIWRIFLTRSVRMSTIALAAIQT